MAVNDVFQSEAQGVADAGTFSVDPSTAATGAAEVFEIMGSAGGIIYKQIDAAGDGTYELEFEIDRFGSAFHSQKNQIVISDSKNSRLVVENNSGGTADYSITGMEIND